KYLGEAELKVLRPMLGLLGQAASSILSTTGDTPGGSRPAPPPVETVGRYRILGIVGRGGMGAVYKAHDPDLNRVVAVKVPSLDPARADHDVGKERFRREMQAAAKVRDANVCEIHDTGDADGVPFAVMPFLEGSLADLLGKGPMPVRQAAEMARKIAL